MKKHLIIILVFSFSFSSMKAQWVTIPDTALVSYLQVTFPACMNGNLMDTTCSAVITATSVYCSHGNISNLDGIQYFDALQILQCSDNYLIGLPPLPAALTELVCSRNQITALPALPNSLTSLFCSNNNLNSLPVLPNTLTTFYCDANSISVLPALPANLTTLICSYNHLTGLPALSGSITELNCNNNKLTALPVLPNALQNLQCVNNPLHSLPTLPASLGDFNCCGDSLLSLPPLPVNLYRLACADNQLSILPALPNSLIELQCSSNLLMALPNLPAAILNLDCSHNPYITSLPVLPTSLTILHCEMDSITVLPTLPPNLNTFYCDFNPITQLPVLPSTLRYLFANYCPITSLPALPDTMNYLNVSSDLLTSLPDLPNYIQTLDIRNNHLLYCLPVIKTISTFYFLGTGITCLPNYGIIGVSNPSSSTIPLCSPSNMNGCPIFWNLKGNTYFDSTANCVQDTLEHTQENIHIYLEQNGSLVQQTFTGGDGYYSFDLPGPGMYKISADTSNIPFTILCPLNGLYDDTVTTGNPLHSSNNFALVCKDGFDVGVWNTVGVAHPARNTGISVFAADIANFFGAHCAYGISGTVSITISGPVTVISGLNGNTSPSSITGNTLIWNITDFGTLSSPYFNISILTDTSGSIGEAVCVNTIITTGSGDYNLSNNTGIFCFNVTSAYDPNLKEVYPFADIDTAQKGLTYTIHFQNTGTDTAHHIYVDDTLDTDIDVSTFQLLAYSHQPLVQIKENAVRFNFPNINLPDSNTNEPASHGYVQYKVRLKPNLPIGTQINNTASIYFDFNAPVVTNTTTNTITTATAVSNYRLPTTNIKLFPNPTNTILNIQTENFSPVLLYINDLNGHRISEQKYTPQVDVSSLTSGIYFIELKGTDTIARKKFVKM